MPQYLVCYLPQHADKFGAELIKFRSHVDSSTPRSTHQQRANTKASNSDPSALSI